MNIPMTLNLKEKALGGDGNTCSAGDRHRRGVWANTATLAFAAGRGTGGVLLQG